MTPILIYFSRFFSLDTLLLLYRAPYKPSISFKTFLFHSQSLSTDNVIGRRNLTTESPRPHEVCDQNL